MNVFWDIGFWRFYFVLKRLKISVLCSDYISEIWRVGELGRRLKNLEVCCHSVWLGLSLRQGLWAMCFSASFYFVFICKMMFKIIIDSVCWMDSNTRLLYCRVIRVLHVTSGKEGNKNHKKVKRFGCVFLSNSFFRPALSLQEVPRDY